jgi:ribosomal protein S16
MGLRIILRETDNGKTYKLVVVRRPANRIICRVGSYVPLGNKCVISYDKLKYWRLMGAVLSKRVAGLVGKCFYNGKYDR